MLIALPLLSGHRATWRIIPGPLQIGECLPKPCRQLEISIAPAPTPLVSPFDLLNNGSLTRAVLQARPSSTFKSNSRQPSYYATYPVATPSTMSYDHSPPMPSSTSGSPPLSAQDGGPDGPAKKKNTLTPINTAFSRSDSSSPGEQIMMARDKTSFDRSAGQSERAPSPTSIPFPTSVPSEGGHSSGNNSPHPSSLSYSARLASQSPGYPSRPYSMTSISSSVRPHVGPVGGAPHQGRHVQLEMPRLLGARPDETGDFFWGTARPSEGFNLSSVNSRGGHQRMTSGPHLDAGELPSVQRDRLELTSPDHTPPTASRRIHIPSSQSTSRASNPRPGNLDSGLSERAPDPGIDLRP